VAGIDDHFLNTVGFTNGFWPKSEVG